MIRPFLLILSIAIGVLYGSAEAQQQRLSVNVSSSQAAQIAAHRVPGRVLKVTTGQRYYRVKILKESGRVVVVVVNNSSGKVVRVEGE
ncbi:hypothetical protein HMF8227_01226 [Saliniradius amylolyticus]|uniref:PepSY domain-containing protein n=1 Tax=Saliniradius amylolyticus TaxID=2183582 RepID=A0A2S2E3W7_9ALTE|nr:hypothetical protein [Saliniradius amylolyticus]AWL11707.1 hypothetical protein HMF8227_01226 [Saliniradius amylolyticus]